MTVTLCEQVIEITSNYLGPTARRFVYRQVEVHLGKPPEKLSTDDIEVLADWAKLALGLISNDKDEVDQFQEDLLSLKSKNPSGHKLAAAEHS